MKLAEDEDNFIEYQFLRNTDKRVDSTRRSALVKRPAILSQIEKVENKAEEVVNSSDSNITDKDFESNISIDSDEIDLMI